MMLIIYLILNLNSLFNLVNAKITHEPTKWTKTVQIAPSDSILIDYYNSNVLQHKDMVYRDYIKTVRFYRQGDEQSNPIVPLAQMGDFPLVLTFDDLEGGIKNYSYTIVHCTANWKPSLLSPFDYIDGFTEENITDYAYSINTLQNYTHYAALMLGRNMRVTKSGNYLLKVYESGQQDKPILTRRFMVYENKVTIRANLVSPISGRYLQTHQRLDFSIAHHGFRLLNPLQEIKVVLMQNGRWDNAFLDLKPTFLQNKELLYQTIDRYIFKSGNEFRYFNMRSLLFATERIQQMKQVKGKNQVYLVSDLVRKRERERERAFKFNYRDANGKFSIGIHEAIFGNLDADYATVHFTLVMDKPIVKGNIYLFGALTDWNIQPDFQLQWNVKRKVYEGIADLKQGIYDYQYVLVEDESNTIDASAIEGNYYMTENEYQILVYYTGFGKRYDRLIAFKRLNSRF